MEIRTGRASAKLGQSNQTDNLQYSYFTLVVRREEGRGPCPHWILKFSAKRVVFLVSSGNKQISPLLAPHGKI